MENGIVFKGPKIVIVNDWMKDLVSLDWIVNEWRMLEIEINKFLFGFNCHHLLKFTEGILHVVHPK